jgi:hypothetical protein
MKLMKFRFFALSVLFALFSSAFATLPSKAVQDSLDAEVENLASRRGLDIGGTVRSVMIRSSFSSPQDINAYDKSPDVERSGFSQLDLRLGVRPYDAVRAAAVIRMSAEYQDYFDFGHKSITIPWINIEGQVFDKFYWVVGDFRGQYSPLSLYSPDAEVLYEPEIYARSRYMARDQVFLQGNKRNLQGVNLQFRNDFGGMPGELRVEGIFSRLRRIEILDFSGYMGNILPNEQDTPGASQASAMHKLLYTGTLEWLPFSKNAMLGFTPIFIKDLKSSETVMYKQRIDEFGTAWPEWEAQSVNPGVLGPEDTQILSFRGGADVAGFLGNENLIANLTGEFALSKDKLYRYGENEEVNAINMEGQAILAQLVVGWQNKDSWVAKVNANYMLNDSAWYNPLAQSPAFFARRVMNSDKDGDVLKYGSRSPFYSTFDALYHFVPKFTPVSRNRVPNATAFTEAEQFDSYNIAPFSKNSYNTAVYTRDELALIQSLSDPVLQGSLPNGLASANRIGPNANLILGMGKDNALEVQGVFSMLQEDKAAGEEKAEFTEFGGGGKFDVGSYLWGVPLELSGSYKLSNAKRGDIEFESSFINAGFYARYFKRFGVCAGFQLITTENKNYSAYYPIDGEQMQWMAGLDYTLADNAWVAINFGQINVVNHYSSNLENILPLYIEEGIKQGTLSFGDKIEHKFKQNLVEASINVSF